MFNSSFRLDANASVYFEKMDGVNYPLALMLKDSKGQHLIVRYEVNGDDPHVEMVFFITMGCAKNIVAIISRKQEC